MVVLTDAGAGSRSLNRRTVLLWVVAGAGGVVLAGCGTGSGSSSTVPAVGEVDFSARFAAFAPADEPNGDLAKVVWPTYVLSAGKDIKQLYEFQVLNGDLMRWMPCFCGCKGDGHHNNRDCYVKAVNPDGSVVFDAMAPT